MRRDQLPMHIRPTFVLPQYKTVYVAVSKAACTSLKWMVAELMGEDPEGFHRSVSRMVSRDMCIHHRSRWRHTPTLHSLPDEQLADIDPENGWFVFAVVRHPSARLFSAWQSKLLLREPVWVDKMGDRPWFPRVPRGTQDVVEDFAGFVTALAADPSQRIMRDRHFMAQWEEAAPDRVPYSRLYDTSEIPRLLEDLGAHLRAHGFEGELSLRQSNETPLRPIAALFPPEVRAGLQSLYADDFRELRYDDVVPPKLHPADAYPDAAFDEIARLIERNERIGDLTRMAKEAQAAHREARRALKQARAADAAAAQQPLRSVVGRVARKVAPSRSGG